MPGRTLDINGARWTVSSTGRITQYAKDEFALLFTRISPEPREHRVVRYSPQGSKNRESALAQLSDPALLDLFKVSQPSWTTPDLEYRR